MAAWLVYGSKGHDQVKPGFFKTLGFYSGDRKMNAASSSSQRFPREARLLRRVDFQRVYELGRRHFSSSMTVFYLLRSAGGSGEKEGGAGLGSRIGITVGRVLGKAVERVRIKRRIRNAVRLHLATLRIPVDVVINPKRLVLKVEFTKLEDEIQRTFEVVNQKAKLPEISGVADRKRARSEPR